MRQFYFVMAIVGALLPFVFFYDFFQGASAAGGNLLIAFTQALFVNGAAGGFAVDLVISSLVFWIYMFTRDGFKLPWVFIVINVAVGLSCALPAYLFFKSSSRAA